MERAACKNGAVLGMALAVLLLGMCAEARAQTTFAWDFEGAPVNGPATNIGDGGTMDVTYDNGAVTTSTTAAFGNDSFSLASSGLTRGKMLPFFTGAQTKLSISVWVYAAGHVNNAGVIDRTSDFDPFDDSRFSFGFFGVDEFRPQVLMRDAGGNLSANIANLGGVANQWNNYAVSYDGTQPVPTNRLRMWVNSVETPINFAAAEVPTQIGSVPTGDGEWRLGIRIDGSNPLLDGFIDEVLITDQTLSSSDVNILYNAGVAAFLSGVLPGDFDLDGNVDGNDFLSWQQGGSPNPLSASDLADWEAFYGTTSPALAAGVSNVPEPASMILVMLGSLTLLARRRR